MRAKSEKLFTFIHGRFFFNFLSFPYWYRRYKCTIFLIFLLVSVASFPIEYIVKFITSSDLIHVFNLTLNMVEICSDM